MKHPVLDFGFGHDVVVWEISPQLGLCSDCMEPDRYFLSLSLSAFFLLSLFVSLSKNKVFF